MWLILWKLCCGDHAMMAALKIMLQRACCEYNAVQRSVRANCTTGTGQFSAIGFQLFSASSQLSVPRQQKTPLGIKWLHWTMNNIVGRILPLGWFVLTLQSAQQSSQHPKSTHPHKPLVKQQTYMLQTLCSKLGSGGIYFWESPLDKREGRRQMISAHIRRRSLPPTSSCKSNSPSPLICNSKVRHRLGSKFWKDIERNQWHIW